jgi:hypothetical protein
VSVYSGKVVNGMVLVKGALLPEGATVTILVPDDEDEPFYLDAEMQEELERSIAQADRGETIPAEQVLEELRERTRSLRSGAPR